MKFYVESQEQITYYYNGPVRDSFNRDRGYVNKATKAVSKNKAISNILSQVRADLGLTQSYKLFLDTTLITTTPPHDTGEKSTHEPEVWHSKNNDIPRYCEKCGTQLNDGGTCPVCDDGETDY